MNSKKYLSGILVSGLLLSTLTAPVSALNIKDDLNNAINSETNTTVTTPATTQTAKISDFTDMTPNGKKHWSYDYVARMVKDGLFVGKTDTTFAPNDTMTEIEFLTVVLRKAFPTELAQYNAQYTDTWYTGAYRLGIAKGIISNSTYSSDYIMSKTPITREKMTDMIILAMEATGIQTSSNASGVNNHVADINECSGLFKSSMIKAYTMGIIAGKTEDKSTGKMLVKPDDTATRAEGATILYRFAYFDEVTPPDLSGSVLPETGGALTIQEGQKSVRRPAKAGNVVVKSDGTQVVLQVGPSGVLGEGQGVAADLGMAASQTSLDKNYIPEIATNQQYFIGHGDHLKDSLGNDLTNQMYKINPWTGEGHWDLEWQEIMENNPAPSEAGQYQGQLSADKIWVWITVDNTWNLACNFKNAF